MSYYHWSNLESISFSTVAEAQISTIARGIALGIFDDNDNELIVVIRRAMAERLDRGLD